MQLVTGRLRAARYDTYACKNRVPPAAAVLSCCSSAHLEGARGVGSISNEAVPCPDLVFVTPSQLLLGCGRCRCYHKQQCQDPELHPMRYSAHWSSSAP